MHPLRQSTAVALNATGQEVTKNVQPLRPGEVTQAHGIDYPDGVDGDHLLGHGSTSASADAGRSAALICPCISSTTLVAVSAPLFHAAMTACA